MKHILLLSIILLSKFTYGSLKTISEFDNMKLDSSLSILQKRLQTQDSVLALRQLCWLHLRFELDGKRYAKRYVDAAKSKTDKTFASVYEAFFGLKDPLQFLNENPAGSVKLSNSYDLARWHFIAGNIAREVAPKKIPGYAQIADSLYAVTSYFNGGYLILKLKANYHESNKDFRKKINLITAYLKKYEPPTTKSQLIEKHYEALKASLFIDLFNAFKHLNQVDSALIYLDSAKTIYFRLNDKNGKSLVYGGEGTLYYQLNKLPQAYESLLRGYSLVKENPKYFRNEIVFLSYLSSTLDLMGLYKEALIKAEEQLKKVRERKLLYPQARTLMNIAGIYLEMQKYDKVLHYTDSAEEIYSTALKKNEYRYQIPVLRAYAFYSLWEIHKSHQYLDSLNVSFDRVPAETPYYWHILKAYIHYAEGRYSEALKTTSEIKFEQNDYRRNDEVDQLRLKIYKKQKKYDMYFKVFENWQTRNDSVKKQYAMYQKSMADVNQKLIEENIKKDHDLELSKASLALKKKQSETQKLYIISLILLFVIVFIGIIVYYQRRLTQAKLKKLSIQNAQMQVQQAVLHQQMNPHFISNLLASVQANMFHKDQELSHQMMSEFGIWIRNVLNYSQTMTTSLKEEVQWLKRYMHFMQFIHPNQFSVEFDDQIDHPNKRVPAFMIQPLIENAIEYGALVVPNDQGFVKIQLTSGKDALSVNIQDNGPGMPPEVLQGELKQGHALYLVRKRLSLLTNQLKQPLEWSFQNTKQGALVKVKIPYISTEIHHASSVISH